MLLDLVLMNEEGLVGDVKVRGSPLAAVTMIWWSSGSYEEETGQNVRL